MNIETNRLNTFNNWPSSAPVDPIRIAKAGFYYTGEGTEVQCFSCGGKISEWNYGDQVMWRHRQMEPNCAFVVNPQLSGNIPLVLGRECPSIDTSSVTVAQEQPDSTQPPQDYGLREEDEMYRSDALRLLSFINWEDPSVSREVLVNAGFYHAGEGRLRCAWCGGELAPFRNLGTLGHPLDVHRMYFPRCTHAAALEVAQRALPPPSPPTYTPPIQSPSIQSPSIHSPPIHSPLLQSPTQSPPDSTNHQPQSSGAAHNERLLSGGGGGTWRALGVVGGGARHPTRVTQSPPDSTNHQPQSSGAAHNERLLSGGGGGTWRALGVVGGGARHPTRVTQSPPDSTNHQPQSSGAAHNERLLSGGGGGTWRALGVVGGGARHPTRAALAARLATFERWPADRTQTPRALADAGFFYTGTDDQVRCFYCDGGLGKWEACDAPWREHARWFPHCGYVLLVKGRRFVDSCRAGASVQRCLSAESGLGTRLRGPGVNFPVTEGQVEQSMESDAALAALGAGLDAARVRRALVKRLRTTGLPFSSSEALIDAVLDEQLNEEAWSVSPQSQRLARDILAETLRDFAPRSGMFPSSQDDSSDNQLSHSDSPARSPTPTPRTASQPNLIHFEEADTSNAAVATDSYTEGSGDRHFEEPDTSNPRSEPAETQRDGTVPDGKKLTLEEENRQLKEARLCKVCMDSEVSVVFLPCGHLVSCGGCGAALSACPLCRCAVRALVRAYLA